MSEREAAERPKFQPGQQVFVSWYGRRGNSSFETIEKVGTKWAHLTLGRYRFDVKTLLIDHGGYGSSPGRIYLTEGDYLREKELNELWRAFRQAVSSIQHPSKLTADAIRQAASALGIPLKPEEPT